MILYEKINSDKKLKNINNKVPLNKIKHVKAEKKLTDLRKKLHKYQKIDVFFVVHDVFYRQ